MHAAASEWDATGYLGLETQGFWQSRQFAGQEEGVNLSAIVQPEFYWQNDDGRQRLSFVAFARLDGHDDERTHADIREASWSYEARAWDLTIGIGKVFWGVTESRHLVDTINQTDLVEDIDQEDKLGQPLINLNVQRDYGRFELFILPWFRERTFPGLDGRFRTPLPVDTDNPIYESSDEEQHVDVAFRYSHYIGDLDLGLHVFDGTAREPAFRLAPDGQTFLPVYEQTTQFGVDLQYTRDAWLWKLEAITREAASDNFFAAVGGFEYSIYGIRGSDADLGLLVEYQYDDRSDRAPPTISEDDVFLGARLTMNDADDTNVLAGAAVDVDTQEVFLNLEAERRFGDQLTAELRVRAFGNASADGFLRAFRQDDYVQLRLSWYY